VLIGSVGFSPQTSIVSLNSVNRLMFVMVKCGVFFEVRTEFLNIISTSFIFLVNLNVVKELYLSQTLNNKINDENPSSEVDCRLASQKFSSFYVTQKIIVSTTTRRSYLSSPTLIQPFPHSTTLRQVFILSSRLWLGLSSCLFNFMFPDQNCIAYTFIISSCVLHDLPFLNFIYNNCTLHSIN
jgi:hypothetical protein